MQGPARNRRRSGTMGSQDLFEGFGMGGGRGGLFPEFFDRDPFDDPFFTQPFGSFFGSSGGVFGPSSFFGGHQARGFVDERPYALQQESHRGPVIEELPDDHEAPNASVSKYSKEPIVEHPDDDDVHPAYVKEQNTSPKLQKYSPSQPNNFCQSYSYSSVTYGGPGGAYYTSSTTRRSGADGVIEEEHEEKDSTIGQETKRVSRGLGNKGHSVTRKRNVEGTENVLETLHNLTEEEKNDFDRTWQERAEKSLPGWDKRRVQMLETGHGGSGKHSRAVLPSIKESSWRWPWSKHA